MRASFTASVGVHLVTALHVRPTTPVARSLYLSPGLSISPEARVLRTRAAHGLTRAVA